MAYMNLHIKSSFPKRGKRHCKKNGFQMSMPNSDIVFWGRALHKYVNILVYAELFSKKPNLKTWDRHLKPIFWNGA